MAGIKITLRDPSDISKLIHAEFATARSFPVLKDKLRAIALADTAESMAAHKRDLTIARLGATTTASEVDGMADEMQSAAGALDDASNALFDAILDFVLAGYTLAGASDDIAQQLVSLTPIEKLPELKGKCLYGAGCMDFTTGGAQ